MMTFLLRLLERALVPSPAMDGYWIRLMFFAGRIKTLHLLHVGDQTASMSDSTPKAERWTISRGLNAASKGMPA
jgi:hypothetical protein